MYAVHIRRTENLVSDSYFCHVYHSVFVRCGINVFIAEQSGVRVRERMCALRWDWCKLVIYCMYVQERENDVGNIVMFH